MSRLRIRDRVTIAAALTLACGLAVVTLAVTLLLAHRLDRDADSVLRTRASAVLTTLAVTHGRVSVRDTLNDELLDRDTWVFDAGGTVERPQASPAAAQAVADQLAHSPSTSTRTVGQTKLLAAAVLGADQRRAGTVVVGVSTVPYRHTLRIALAGMIVLDLFVLIAGALVARRAVGIGLRPVADMTAKAAEWSDHDLDQRFALGPPRDELTALSATLDALLARIGASIRHEQRFSAEVAHELNTPLSGLRAEAELALRSGATPDETRRALQQVLRSTDRMAAVISTLLSAARTVAEHSPGSSDSADALRGAVEGVADQAAARGIEIELSVPEHVPLVGAERDMVAQALNPLLENAIRHATRRVDVSLARRGEQVIFEVRDDGSGVDPARRDQIFEPGMSDRASAGLGLALSRRLARACAGDLVLGPSEVGGGACFELRIPAIDQWQPEPALR
jgi:two-component system OmpR family sensor kinase